MDIRSVSKTPPTWTENASTPGVDPAQTAWTDGKGENNWNSPTEKDLWHLGIPFMIGGAKSPKLQYYLSSTYPGVSPL